MVAVPNPSTVAAGAKSLASTWNTDVRDADLYFAENLSGFGHRNGLVNSHFDIWQAGTSFAITSLATSKYCADQWYVRTNGTSNVAVTQVAGPTGQRYAMQVQRVASNANTTPIEVMQPLETPESYRYAGQTCQLKLNLKAGVNFSPTSGLVTVKVTYGTGTDQAPPASGWTGTADAYTTTQAITTTATDYVFDSISIPSNATQIQVSVSWTPTGTASTYDLVVVGAGQLTVGKCASWERLPYAPTLLRAQRFFRRIVNLAANQRLCYAQATGTGGGAAIIMLDTPMRTAPTHIISSASHFSVLKADGSGSLALSSFSDAGSGSAPNAFTFNYANAAGSTTGQCTFIYANSASATFDLTARL